MYLSLKACAAAVREFPNALAHYAVTKKPGTEQMELVNKLYRGLALGEQLIVRNEMLECKQAIRGNREARAA
jgi:hypothetical protein